MITQGRNLLERFILQLKAFILNFVLFLLSPTLCHPFLGEGEGDGE